MIRSLSAAALSCLLLAGAAQALAQAVPPAIAAAVADPARPEADRSRDASRHPAEVLAFAGVRPGMVIGELIPGAGYYTRILAKAVGPTGKVYTLAPPRLAANAEAMAQLNAVAKAYPNVKVMAVDTGAMVLPEKLDMYWTTENYHDLHIGPTADIAAFNRSVYASLKPGGTFLVEDHAAKAGLGPSAPASLHRIEEAQAKTEVQAAGFRIDGESNLVRNPQDPGDITNRETGVQGHTDRFLLRLKRP